MRFPFFQYRDPALRDCDYCGERTEIFTERQLPNLFCCHYCLRFLGLMWGNLPPAEIEAFLKLDMEADAFLDAKKRGEAV